jgi:hypothetical protein
MAWLTTNIEAIVMVALLLKPDNPSLGDKTPVSIRTAIIIRAAMPIEIRFQANKNGARISKPKTITSSKCIKLTLFYK